MSTATFQTLGQRYAQAAWAAVTQRVPQNGTSAPSDNETHKRYRARCRSLPVMIHQCGLAQAVAFCQSRASQPNDPYQYGAWLADIAHILYPQKAIDDATKELANRSRTSTLQDYMHLTHQVLHAASWLKNYAEALIERGDDNDDRGEDE